MREYICDLCKKRITPADIRRSFEVEVDDKTDRGERTWRNVKRYRRQTSSLR